MNKRIVLIILFIYLLGVIAVFSSCTSVKKLRSNVHQETVKTETVNKSDTKDSTSKTITKTIDSSGITVTVVYDSTSTDTATVFDIVVYPPTATDYTERVQVKSSRKPKAITFQRATKKENYKSDSTVRKSLIVEDTDKKEQTKAKAKASGVEKKRFNWGPVFAGIALLAIICIYYYRKPIRTFIIKLISPLKFLS